LERDENRLNVESPIREGKFAHLKENATVQVECYGWPPPIREADYPRLAGILEERPKMTLRVYGGGIKNLDFLKHFPRLRRFDVDYAWAIESLDGLNYLPSDLVSLELGATKSKFSLRTIGRFLGLEELYLEGQTKDIEVVSRFTGLKKLKLRSVTLPDLAILKPMRELWWLEIKLGGTKDLSLLGQIGRLKYLELWLIRGLTDITAIGDITTLQYLFLQSLKHVTSLPPFERLRELRRVYIEDMKGIRDLSPLLSARWLEDLAVVNMPHLKPPDLAFLKSHPSLKHTTIGLGSFRKNDEVSAMLGLPWLEADKRDFAFH
jgi:hypothetical protein